MTDDFKVYVVYANDEDFSTILFGSDLDLSEMPQPFEAEMLPLYSNLFRIRLAGISPF